MKKRKSSKRKQDFKVSGVNGVGEVSIQTLHQAGIISEYDKLDKERKQPDPFTVAIFTATLAGAFSIVGSYFAVGFQSLNAVAQKQIEYRSQSYSSFLDKIDSNQSPVLSQIISAGSLAGTAATDSEIQSLEDRFAALLRKASVEDLYWQLNGDLNIVRLHGSARVRRVCDDILKTLYTRSDEIDWSFYPPEIKEWHMKEQDDEDKDLLHVGWEPKIAEDERMMVIVASKLFEFLVQEMRNELQSAPPK